MRKISLEGINEERSITDQIERAKIALCIDHYKRTNELVWLEMANEIAERANGYWSAIRDSADDLDGVLLCRERIEGYHRHGVLPV